MRHLNEKRETDCVKVFAYVSACILYLYKCQCMSVIEKTLLPLLLPQGIKIHLTPLYQRRHWRWQSWRLPI